MRTTGTLCLLALSALGLVGCAAPRAAGKPSDARMTDLMKRTLDPEFIAGREVIVTLVEIPPHVTLERHWHPGEEFHYYLEGEVTIAIDGQAPIHGTPGTVGHVPLRRLHTAITGDRGAKLVVFRVHAAGEPMRYLESPGAADR